MLKTVLRWTKAICKPPLLLIAALLFLLEEVLWARLGALMAAIGRWPPVTRLEAGLRHLPPYPALAVLALPIAIVWPLKLFALWLITLGNAKLGVILLVLAEILGAAIIARLYALLRPSLQRLAWLVRVESVVLGVSRWAHQQIDRFTPWQEIKHRVRSLFRRLKAVWRSA